MSIDAKVVGIELVGEEAVIYLSQPDPKRVAGQGRMIVLSPLPGNLGLLLGKDVWGGDSSLMLGQTQIGSRVGFTEVQLDGFSLNEALKPRSLGLACLSLGDRNGSIRPWGWKTDARMLASLAILVVLILLAAIGWGVVAWAIISKN